MFLEKYQYACFAVRLLQFAYDTKTINAKKIKSQIKPLVESFLKCSVARLILVNFTS